MYIYILMLNCTQLAMKQSERPVRYPLCWILAGECTVPLLLMYTVHLTDG